MIIRVSDMIGRNESEKEIRIDISSAQLKDSEVLFDSDVRVTGKLISTEDKLIARLTAQFRAGLTCSRCTKVFFDHYVIEFEEVIDLDNPEIVEGELDFVELVRDNILVRMPTQPLCDEHCKGLCFVCGQDKNTHDCDCETEELDPRLAELKNLLDGE